MLELHTRQVYTVDATAIKRARKNEKEQLRGDKAEVPPWDGQTVSLFNCTPVRRASDSMMGPTKSQLII